MYKKVKKLLTFIIVYTCSLQMAFAGVNFRSPSSTSQVDLDLFVRRVENYKKTIKGYEKPNDCKEEEARPDFDFSGSFENIISSDGVSDEAFFSEMKKRHQLSCDAKSKNEDPKAAVAKQTCQKEKVKGLIDALVEVVNKDEAKLVRFNSSYNSQIAEAKRYAENIKEILTSDLDEDQKKTYLFSYIHNVLLPLRDLVAFMRVYNNSIVPAKIFKGLYPVIDADLFESEEELQKLKLGIDPYKDPVHFIVSNTGDEVTIAFDEYKMVERDISVLMMAPTAKSYFQALRWMTIQMMLTQVKNYDVLLGKADDLISVPKACQQKVENGSLPATVEIKINEKIKDNYAEALVANLGYIDSEYGQFFREYYIENANSDAVIDGHSGLVPFEEYQLAKQYTLKKERGIFTPVLDDITHFEKIISLKMQAAADRLKTKEEAELFSKIVSAPKETEYYEVVVNGEKELIQPYSMNLSPYMAELMQRKGTLDVSEIIPSDVARAMEKRKVKISFPSFNTNSFWRNWALRKLSEKLATLEKGTKEYGTITLALSNFCGVGYAMKYMNPVCMSSKNKIDALKEMLNSVVAQEEGYLPVRRLKEEELDKVYAMYALVWTTLRDKTTMFPEANTNEREFLLSQLEANNPWARVRLSYLLAEYELSGFVRDMLKGENYYSCLWRSVATNFGNIKAAAKKIGINKTLIPFYGDNLLSKDEKEYVWNKIIEEKNKETEQILSSRNSKEEFFSIFENLSYETALGANDVEKFTRTHLDENLSEKTWEEINTVLSTVEAERIQQLGDIFKAKGDISKQEELFASYAKDFGVASQYDVKDDFLALENAIKKPIYLELVSKAAQMKKNSLLNQMAKLCVTDLNDHEQLKRFFYGTAKVQGRLNSMLGLPSVPAEVSEQIDKWTTADTIDLTVGIGAPLLAISVVLLSGTCIAATGGLCAAFVLGAGTAGVGLQSWLATREYGKFQRSKDHVAFVQGMEDFGLTDVGSTDEVSVSWGWAAFEAISVIPLLGTVGRSVKMGSSLLRVSSKSVAGNQHLSKLAQKELLRESGGTVTEEIQTDFARQVLGFKKSELLPELERVANEKQAAELVDKIRNLRSLQSQGLISKGDLEEAIVRIRKELAKNSDDVAQNLYRYNADEIVDLSHSAINDQTVKTVAKYFNNNTREFLTFLKSYDQRLFSDSSKLALFRLKNMKMKNGTYSSKILNFFREMRYGHMGRHATKVKKMIKELKRNPDVNLSKYIEENIDELTDFFVDVSSRKREWPYMMFLQGGPHIGGLISGKRASFQFLADGIIMRKFFNARARLILESTKKEARDILGLAPNVRADRAVEVVRAFNESVASAALKMPQKEAIALAEAYGKLQKEVSGEILNGNYNKKLAKLLGNDVSEARIKSLMFHSTTIEEQALGNALWKIVDIENFIGTKSLEGMAHQVIRKLSLYNNTAEFNDYLNALRVLVMKKQKGIVEIL